MKLKKDFFLKLFWKTFFFYFLTNLYSIFATHNLFFHSHYIIVFTMQASICFVKWLALNDRLKTILTKHHMTKLIRLLIISISCQKLEFWNMLMSPQQPFVSNTRFHKIGYRHSNFHMRGYQTITQKLLISQAVSF